MSNLPRQPDERAKAFKTSPHSPTLAFKMATGNVFSYQYTHLMNIDFVLSEGIILRFTRAAFKLTGRNLEELYTALLGHGVSQINITPPPLDDDIPERRAAVTDIEIIEGTHDLFFQEKTPTQSD